MHGNCAAAAAFSATKSIETSCATGTARPAMSVMLMDKASNVILLALRCVTPSAGSQDLLQDTSSGMLLARAGCLCTTTKCCTTLIASNASNEAVVANAGSLCTTAKCVTLTSRNTYNGELVDKAGSSTLQCALLWTLGNRGTRCRAFAWRFLLFRDL